MITGRDHYLLLKKMEDYDQDLADLVTSLFGTSRKRTWRLGRI